MTFEGTSATTLSGTSSNPSSGSSPTFGSTGSSSSTFPKAAIAGIAAGAFLLALVCFRYARRNCGARTIYIPPAGASAAATPTRDGAAAAVGASLSQQISKPCLSAFSASKSRGWQWAPLDGANPSFPRPSGAASRRGQQDGSNNTNYPPSPPAAPRVPMDGADPNLLNADRTQRTSRGGLDGSNSESNLNILWDGASPNANSTYAPSTPGQSYFTYSEKEGKTAWAAVGRAPGSDILVPDSIPTLLRDAGSGSQPNLGWYCARCRKG